MSCSNSNRGDEPRVRFDLRTDVGSLEVANLPFPNDLFIESGELTLAPAGMPFSAQADALAVANLATAFEHEDCFGVTSSVMFPLDNTDNDRIDTGSLEGAVVLIDVDTDTQIPIDVHYRPREGLISVRPQRGHVLREATTYAAWLTGDIRTESGSSLRAAPAFTAAMKVDGPAAYEPLRAYVARSDVDSASMSGATVFSTCEYGSAFESIVEQLDAMAGPVVSIDQVYVPAQFEKLLGTPAEHKPGIDNDGGIAHDNIGFIVLGRYDSPNYQSAVPNKLGFFSRDASGLPVVKGTDSVPFILVVPAQVASIAELPTVVYQHGINDNFGATLAVGNTLAGAGFAVIGIDLPYHGHRYPEARDNSHNFSETSGPDGIADPTGPTASMVFFDIVGDDQADRLDPRVMTDGFRQAAVDLMTLARVVARGDWSALGAAESALTGIGFRGDRLVYSSESFGGFVGTLALAFDPSYQAAFTAVAGGGLMNDVLINSPRFAPLFNPIIQGSFGVSPADVDYDVDPPPTHYLYQLLGSALGRGDPIAYAHRLGPRGVHMFLPAAYSDESVPNQATEALASVAGLPWLALEGAVDGPTWTDPELFLRTQMPASSGFVFIDPAGHGMLTRQHAERGYAMGFPPFSSLSAPEPIDNPIELMQSRLLEFSKSYVETGVPMMTR